MKFLAITGLAAAALCIAADGPQPGASRAAAYARALHDAGLDPDACYRVRDLSFQKDDLRFYLNEGHLIFSRPVEGRRFAAMFTTEIPGGDAEVILFPPQRSERVSLAQFTNSPNLDEHFTAALFLFTDGTGEQLMREIESNNPKKLPEIGTALASGFSEMLRNISGSYQIRLVEDHFSAHPDESGFFYAAVNGKELGMFDMLFDPRQRDQILVGRLAYRQDRRYFDTWTSFPARSFRNGGRAVIRANAELSDIQINVALEGPELAMKAHTSMTFTPRYDGDSVLAFELSRQVRITEAKVDGQPVEVFSPESIRANLVRGSENDLFLVLLPAPMVKGEKHRIEFAHEGNVVMSAGNGVYFVGARLNWYPNREAQFARYQMTFRYPKNLKLVATGDITEEKTDGEWRISRFATSSPIRFAGFNLGNYESVRSTRAGVLLEVCANRAVESALQPRHELVLPPPIVPPGRRNQQLPLPAAAPPVSLPSPTSRLEQLSSDIGGALEFMAANFGPPPLKRLSVSPIPGAFGQGFPGLLYLSTLAYLRPSDRPPGTQYQRTFYSELLHAHETAHQWWGNLVTSAQRQDDWLMESLANYSALMALERRKGRRPLDHVLDEYRNHLLSKMENGKTVESAGPIVWGVRLSSSQAGNAWRTIVYEKGSWILHMLRERLGDENFLRMAGEIAKRKRFGSLSTEEFRAIAAEFMPAKSEDPKLENFFDAWVYNTGIPGLKLTWTVQGKAPRVKLRGVVTQSDVSEDFGTSVPVEITLPGKKVVRRWVRTSSDATEFTVDLTQTPLKVSLDPGNAVLARR